MAVDRKTTTPLAEGPGLATVLRPDPPIASHGIPSMRTACCLLSASALLFGALATGNPFLPRRGEGANANPSPRAGDAVPAGPLVLQPRGKAKSLVTAPLWAVRAPSQQSPADMLTRMPRLVSPFVQPAIWRVVPATKPVHAGGADSGLGMQRPQ